MIEYANYYSSCCNQCGNKEDIYAVGGEFTCYNCLTKTEHKKSNWFNTVTPQNLKEFIGQDHIKEELNTMIKASKVHNIPVQSCLFSGNFGLGKSSLARIFASMIGEYEFVIASSIKELEDLPNSKCVIVDETHTIKNEEILLHAMDRGEQTILGATTNSGNLSGPLRSRFVTFTLKPYSVNELKQIVCNVSNNLNYKCPEYMAIAVAQRSKSVARTAILLFKRIYDRVILNKGETTNKQVDNWFNDMKIDANGLDDADRMYLNCLNDTRPVGLQNIAAMSGIDTVTITDVIEPFLLTSKFIRRSPRGRLLGDCKPISNEVNKK